MERQLHENVYMYTNKCYLTKRLYITVVVDVDCSHTTLRTVCLISNYMIVNLICTSLTAVHMITSLYLYMYRNGHVRGRLTTKIHQAGIKTTTELKYLRLVTVMNGKNDLVSTFYICSLQ